MTLIVNHQLLAQAFLRELRESPSQVDIVDACRQTIHEWREEYPDLDRPEVLTAYLAQCLSALGFAYERRADPDHFILYSDETRAQPLGVCLAVTDDEVGRATQSRHHHARLIGLLRERQLAWGAVTNGRDWRLCHARASAPYEVYLQVDLDALLDPALLSDFALFYRFFSRDAFEFQPDESKRRAAPAQGLDLVLVESDRRTQAIERHLKSRVEGILQSLCLGFVAQAGAAAISFDRAALDEIYRNAIYLLYRTLFIFYAEARELLPTDHPGYSQISLATLVEAARQRQQEGVRNSDPFSLWKRLTHLCVVVDDGDEALGVRPYNGGLFSDSENPYLRDHTMADDYLAPAIYALAYVEGKGEPRLIDYRDLSVRHLGTLYEGLLEYRLNLVSAEPVVVRESKGKRAYIQQSQAGAVKRSETILSFGQAYFADDRGERKSSGSYYTPEDGVQYIVANTLTPKLRDLCAPLDALLQETHRARAAAVSQAERARLERYADQQTLELVEHKLLGLRILDPAMGSAHFLVAAGQVLTNHIVETLNRTEWPNDSISTDPLMWKRRVVERCLYGVDVNPLSQELAKLALWLSSAAEGKPLTFLDHHLKHGNSLYGTPLKRMSTLPGCEQAEGEDMFQVAFRQALPGILAELHKITGTDSDRIEDVKFKGEANRAAAALATRLRDLANVWLATLFGLTGEDGKPLTEGAYFSLLQDVAQHQDAEAWEDYVAAHPVLDAARRIAKTERFLHWELEFPDAVADGACQFDVIVANPPYVGTSPNVAITELYETAKCGDLYAWIFERALSVTGKMSAVGMIVPLSLAFSRQFKKLRTAVLKWNGTVRYASFDIRPASLFGSSDSPNSQRACIVLLESNPSQPIRLYATNLLRWMGEDRPYLTSYLRYADVTSFANEEVFPKLGDSRLAEFWKRMLEYGHTVKTTMYRPKKSEVTPEPELYPLYVSGSGRYFITAMPYTMRTTGLNVCTWDSEWMRDLALLVLNSNVFYWVWCVLGDGFHVTAEDVQSMVLPTVPQNDVTAVRLRDALLNAAEECATYLTMRGRRVPNHNFNKRMDILVDIDTWIVKQVAPDLSLPRDIFAQCKSRSFLRPLDLSAITGADEAGSDE